MTKAYAALFVGFAIGCFADIFLCRYGKTTGSLSDLVLGVALYAIDTTLWAVSVKLGLKFWRAGLLWTLGSLVVCMIVGISFKERPTLTNWIGVGLAIIAVFFIEIEA